MRLFVYAITLFILCAFVSAGAIVYGSHFGPVSLDRTGLSTCGDGLCVWGMGLGMTGAEVETQLKSLGVPFNYNAYSYGTAHGLHYAIELPTGILELTVPSPDDKVADLWFTPDGILYLGEVLLLAPNEPCGAAHTYVGYGDFTYHIYTSTITIYASADSADCCVASPFHKTYAVGVSLTPTECTSEYPFPGFGGRGQIKQLPVG